MSERYEIGTVVWGHSQWHDDVYSVMCALHCGCCDDWSSIGHCAAIGCNIDVRKDDHEGEAELILVTSDDPPTVVAERLAGFLLHETGCFCSTGERNRYNFRAKRVLVYET